MANGVAGELQRECRRTGFCGHYGFVLYTLISFGLFALISLKFLIYDRTFRCSSAICEYKLLVVLFSLTYTLCHLTALAGGRRALRVVLCIQVSNGTALAFFTTAVGGALVLVTAIVMTIYAMTAFGEKWADAGFYCLCWVLQPFFTLLSIWMKQKEIEELSTEVEITNVEEGSSLSPRLSSALIYQWINRLSEVEYQNDVISIRRTVREVLQHMTTVLR